MFDLNLKFVPDFYADSDVNPILSSSEQKIFILKRDSENSEIYSTFDGDFFHYLTKLPNDKVKTHVMNIYNKNLIFLGIAKTKIDNIIIRPLNTTDRKIAGFALDTQQLKIDPQSGICNSIDECVYAVYFGLLRSTILNNRSEIRKNKDLHKLLSTYLYMIFVKAIGHEKLYSEKQSVLVHIVSIYMYYKHFLKEKHGYILSILEKDYSQIIKKEYLTELLPALDKIENYTSMKDISKIFIDMRIITDSPNVLTMSLLKMLKSMGFYCLFGPLDYFIPLIIILKYPINFIGGVNIPINEKIISSIENIIDHYMDKNKYDLTIVKNLKK